MAAAAAFVELFGEKLVKTMGDDAAGDKTVLTTEALAGKHQVALYFSAHWCPPCRGFTPELEKTYTILQNARKAFEIVFVSGDKDREACKEYHGKMPWLALPYDDLSRKARLNRKYKIRGLPSLIILDGNGNLVTREGRSLVDHDEEGKSFPWTPPTVKSALGMELLKHGKEKVVERVNVNILEGKTVALYFSAQWCPPCRGFTPKLKKIYEKLREADKGGFEFVFVSSDRSQSGFDEYYRDMPWLALPFANRKGQDELISIFGIRSIPSLVTLTHGGSVVVNTTARSKATADPQGNNFPWFPKAINDINEVTDGLNDEICVVALLVGAPTEDQKRRKNDIKAVAEKYSADAKVKKTTSEYRFFFEDRRSQVSKQIRSLCEVEGAKTIILDLGNNGSYYCAKVEGKVVDLIANFEAGKLDKKKVKG